MARDGSAFKTQTIVLILWQQQLQFLITQTSKDHHLAESLSI